MTSSLVWFRRDLRIADNKALHHACQNHRSIVGLFVVTPKQWLEHDESHAKVGFWLGNLRRLSESLARLNIPLLVRMAQDFSGVASIVASIANTYQCDSVYANVEYEVNEVERDTQTKQRLQAAGKSLNLFHDRLIVPPHAVSTNDGRYYSVYTPYRKQWEQVALEHAEVLPSPTPRPHLEIDSDPIPESIEDFDLDLWDQELWPAGEKEASRRIRNFSNLISDYHEARDLPAKPGTSTLSPYLAAGVISPRQCFHIALDANEGELRNLDGPTVWISELAWRDFYSHVLVGFPRVCKSRPFKEKTNSIPWRRDEGEFERWCRGETGYPIVDAGMRQLNETGWMHNRLRMVTAMFLTKNLLIDWRWGEKYFMQNLMDGDLAANNGGWQWSASTGTDAVPYFRIFSPFSQSKRFDEEGQFIKQYCPELTSLPSKTLHDEKKLANAIETQGAEYPPYVVNYKESRSRALETFKANG